MTPLSSGLLRTPVRGERGREEGRIEEGERGERGEGSIEKEGREGGRKGRKGGREEGKGGREEGKEGREGGREGSQGRKEEERKGDGEEIQRVRWMWVWRTLIQYDVGIVELHAMWCGWGTH